MSIIKNDKVSYHTDVTIRRLPKGEVTSFGTTSCVFKHYVQMNNRYFDTPWYLGVGESVFIKAEIEQNAEGYFYGHNRNASGSNNGHSIRKNGANIEWLNGNTVVVSKPWSAGVHLYGWVGTISADTNGCKPWYDGEIISDTLVRGGGRGEYARIGGLIEGTSTTTTDNKYCIHSTASWAIRVYEVTAYSFSSYSGVARYPRMYHMYAASSSDGTAVYMAEPRYSLTISSINDGGSVSGVTRSSSVVDFPDGVSGYGVQFADLREITGSNYTQLLAVLTDDDARKASENADVPYVINGRNFAFKINTVPSGATTSGGVGYADGDIIRGRRPKWDIWNDAIKFGFYIYTVPNTNTRQLKFNIFKDNYGQPTTDMLGVFDGYNTNTEHSHEPQIKSDDGLKLHIHNGAFARCYQDDVMTGSLNTQSSGGTTVSDSDVVYKYNTEVGGNVMIVAGNTLPWNHTESEWQSHGQDNIYGVAARVEYAVGGGSMLMNATSYENTSLCKDSSEAIKNKYRVNGFSAPIKINGTYAVSMLDYIESQGGDVPLKLNLSLITAKTANPSAGQLIDCDRFVSSSKVSASSVNNEKTISSATNYRIMVDNQSSTEIGIVSCTEGYLGRMLQTKFGYDNDHDDVIYIPFLGIQANGQPSWSSKNYSIVPEIYFNNSTSLNKFQHTWGRLPSLTFDTIDAAFPNALDDQSSRTLKQQWWYPVGSPSQDSGFWNNKTFQIKNGGVGSTIAASNTNTTNLRTHTRFAAIKCSDYGFSSQYRIGDNASVIMHVYDASTAPIACGFKDAGFLQDNHAPYFNVLDNGETYSFLNPIPIRMASTASDATILSFIYTRDEQGIYHTDDIPDCSIEVYVNDTLQGTVRVNFLQDFWDGQKVRSSKDYTVGNYSLTIRTDAALPDGYYFRGLDHLYNGGGPCYSFTLKSANGGAAPLNHGDSFAISIGHY